MTTDREPPTAKMIWPPLAGVVVSVATTRKPVIDDPPSDGAVQRTLALVSPAWLAATPVGAAGTPAGRTVLDDCEVVSPAELIAVTLK